MKDKKVLKHRKLIIFTLCILCLVIFFIWQNNSIVITYSEYGNTKIPKSFEGFVIAQVSDLHNKTFGHNQKKLLNKLDKTAPDIILVTGDLIDSKRYNLNPAMDFINGAMKIAPVYYVSGNHESWSGQYATIRSSLINAGVVVLDNSMFQLTIGNSTINLLGLQDPSFNSSNEVDASNNLGFYNSLESWSANEDFQILLSHRPELIDLYADNDIDLVFSGHAHGGQFRLPFLGGLVAPDQGLFPEYTSGRHQVQQTSMYISRGLGNSVIPIRIFNRPEIIVVTLKSVQ